MDTRKKILAVAASEFAEHGLDGSRVDRISAKAGVNKAMIYYYFHSKENLYQAVIESHVEKIGRFLEKTIATGNDLEAFILELAHFYNSMLVENASFIPILLREIAGGGERFRAALSNVIAEKGLIKRLQDIINAGIENGKFRRLDSKQAMISFLGMNIFYLIAAQAIDPIWEIHDERAFRENRPGEIVDLFLYGLKSR
jgi:AcrR family transcriptional regulator